MKHKLAADTAALNRYDLEAVAEMFAENAIYISEGTGGARQGRDAIIKAFKTYFSLHGDQVNVDHNVRQISATQLQSDWSLTATNQRTGQVVRRKGLQAITFNNAGLIERIQVFDF